MTSFGDTKLRSLGDYFASNLSRGADPMWQGWKRIWNSYRTKYVTCRNAKLTPFLHVVFLSIALNYAIDYQHLKGNLYVSVFLVKDRMTFYCKTKLGKAAAEFRVTHEGHHMQWGFERTKHIISGHFCFSMICK